MVSQGSSLCLHHPEQGGRLKMITEIVTFEIPAGM
jgi:hypothetical protein